MHRLVPLIILLLAAAAARADLDPVGRWDLSPDAGVAAVVRVAGDLALVGVDETAGNNPAGRLRLVDVADPAAPAGRGDVDLTGVPLDISIYDGIAAVTWYHARLNRGALALIDLDDPDQPEFMSEVTVHGKPVAVAWQPYFILVAVEGTSAGIGDHLLIEYAADPWHPGFVDTVSLPYAPSAMSLDGDRLYLAGVGGGGVPQCEWFDVSDPTDVEILDSYGLTLLFTSLAAQGDFLHTLLPDGTYVLVDVSSGYHLWFRASLGLAPPPGGLALAGDAVYAAAADGLTVIGTGDPDNPFAACLATGAPAVDVSLGANIGVLLDAAGFWTVPLCAEPMSNEPRPESAPPAILKLDEPYPNPFNPSVTVTYALARPGEARLTVHDARGRHVATLVDGPQTVGTHEAIWDGRDATGKAMPSGTYYLRLETVGSTLTRSATLIR